MFDRKGAKKRAKITLKNHYVIFTICVLLASFIGANYASSTYLIKNDDLGIEMSDDRSGDTFTDLIKNGLDSAEKDVDDAVNKDTNLGPIQLGHTNGVFAAAVNSVTSGSIFVVIYKAVISLSKNTDVWAKVAVICSSLLLALVSVLIRDCYKVIYRRIFLEGFTYDEVKAPRFLYIVRLKKWLNVAWIALKTEVYLMLWWLTIIGGIIKTLSYSQVHYIAAENPSIKSSDCINLSRKMMYGHKWELFKCYVTYLGWIILDNLTLGVSGILYSNAYLESFLVEYYVYLRGLAIENKIEGYELLNDKYLFEHASKEELKEAYADIYENRGVKAEFPVYKNKIKGFFATYLGVVFEYDKTSNQYNKALFDQAKENIYTNVFENKQYPERLSPNEISEKSKKDTVILANRQYCLTTLIVIFFALSFVGWLWEVSLHIVNNGTFVNRGVLLGPWLPVYGSGVLLILLCLYKFRKSVLTEFVSAIVLCGFVEYYTSVFLELTNNGTRWWDYSGYFLNVNGRICAEGLLIFGLGGLASVYFLAPLIDNLLRKVKPIVLKVICALLVVTFVCDVVYSSKHPNKGEGITSDANQIVESERIIC